MKRVNSFIQKVFGKHWFVDSLYEIAGSALVGVAFYNFATAAEFPMSGFSGIALIIYRLTGFPIGFATILLNLPVAFVCFKMIGKQFFFRSVRCMLISSLFVDYIAPLFPLYGGGRLLSALCCGVLGGIGYALIYSRSSSTGGADFVVMAIKSKHQHLKLGTLIFITDLVVVLFAGILFKDFDGIIYVLIINYLYAIIADKLIYGMNSGKMAMIITQHSDVVARKIDETTERGTTIIPAVGGYTGDRRDVVLCACATKEMIFIEDAVKEVDPQAFTVILESNEVIGNGFRSLRVAESEAK